MIMRGSMRTLNTLVDLVVAYGNAGRGFTAGKGASHAA